ncbi:MAG: hypothetical protein QM490_03045, partial [Candidatus Gracilibacteria bacterium]
MFQDFIDEIIFYLKENKKTVLLSLLGLTVFGTSFGFFYSNYSNNKEIGDEIFIDDLVGVNENLISKDSTSVNIKKINNDFTDNNNALGGNSEKNIKKSSSTISKTYDIKETIADTPNNLPSNTNDIPVKPNNNNNVISDSENIDSTDIAEINPPEESEVILEHEEFIDIPLNSEILEKGIISNITENQGIVSDTTDSTDNTTSSDTSTVTDTTTTTDVTTDTATDTTISTNTGTITDTTDTTTDITDTTTGTGTIIDSTDTTDSTTTNTGTTTTSTDTTDSTTTNTGTTT